jgi:hypothetical protein
MYFLENQKQFFISWGKFFVSTRRVEWYGIIFEVWVHFLDPVT